MFKNPFEKMAFVNKARIDQGRDTLIKQGQVLSAIDTQHENTRKSVDDVEQMLLEADRLMSQLESNTKVHQPFSHIEYVDDDSLINNYVERKFDSNMPELSVLELIDFNEEDDISALLHKYEQYAQSHKVDLHARLTSLLSYHEINQLKQYIDDELRYKNAQCDKYDYMIAATAGVIGGLIDVLLVGVPGEGVLTKMADNTADKMIEKFASFCGWKGSREGSSSVQSAIGFLERKYKVNYDHRHGGDVNHLFKMSTKNHHIKSLGHSPDLIGLFFSILGQFTNTAHFISDGKIISIDTDNYELQGHNVIACVFAGFCNWLGHLMSDLGGSSGAQGRGSGIPLPFFSLLQLLNFGSFGQHRQTFATVCVKVFESGYDFRHGMALAIPVVTTELLIRLMYTVKQCFYHEKDFMSSLPVGNIPELRRMLVVGHGTLCLIDAGDAALRSGGEMVAFLTRTNFIAWVRFGLLAYKEGVAFLKSGQIDEEKFDAWIGQEYNKILVT